MDENSFLSSVDQVIEALANEPKYAWLVGSRDVVNTFKEYHCKVQNSYFQGDHMTRSEHLALFHFPSLFRFNPYGSVKLLPYHFL